MQDGEIVKYFDEISDRTRKEFILYQSVQMQLNSGRGGDLARATIEAARITAAASDAASRRAFRASNAIALIGIMVPIISGVFYLLGNKYAESDLLEERRVRYKTEKALEKTEKLATAREARLLAYESCASGSLLSLRTFHACLAARQQTVDKEIVDKVPNRS